MIHTDITNSAQSDTAELLPLSLQTLGFRLMQVEGEQGTGVIRYIIPPLCEIPAGPFLMGSIPGTDVRERVDEMPQHQVTLPSFQIGTFPLTVAEYACAVEAGALEEPTDGYTEEEHGYLWDYQLDERDHPVVNLNWFRALAYVRWLRAITGMDWDLPTEAQWEKAARGSDGRKFPWGNERDASYALESDGVTNIITTIGQFPQASASPYGVCNLVGGVGEWTKSSFRDYPYHADEGREIVEDPGAQRVMRGGYYGGYSAYVHAAYRHHWSPDYVFFYWGTRVVVNGTGRMDCVLSSFTEDWAHDNDNGAFELMPQG